MTVHVLGGVLTVKEPHRCELPTDNYPRGTYAWCDACDTIWWKTTHPMYSGWWPLDLTTKRVLKDWDWQPFEWRKLRWWLVL